MTAWYSTRGCRHKLKGLICAEYISALENHWKLKFCEHEKERLETSCISIVYLGGYVTTSNRL